MLISLAISQNNLTCSADCPEEAGIIPNLDSLRTPPESKVDQFGRPSRDTKLAHLEWVSVICDLTTFCRHMVPSVNLQVMN